jgi:hypothetical protein
LQPEACSFSIQLIQFHLQVFLNAAVGAEKRDADTNQYEADE